MQTQIPGEYAALLQSLSMPGGWADTTPFAVGELNPQMINEAFQQGGRIRQEGLRSQLAERGQNLDWGKAGLGYDTAANALDWEREKFPEQMAVKREEIGATRDVAKAKAGFDYAKLFGQEAGKNARAKDRNERERQQYEGRNEIMQERNRIMDKPPVYNPSEMEKSKWMQQAQLAFEANKKNPNPNINWKTPDDAYFDLFNANMAKIAGGRAGARDVYQGIMPAQPQAPQAQPAATPPQETGNVQQGIQAYRNWLQNLTGQPREFNAGDQF